MDDTDNVSLETIKHSCVKNIKKVQSPSLKITQRPKVSRHKEFFSNQAFLTTPGSLHLIYY